MRLDAPYNGYLKPYEPVIKALAARGLRPMQISKEIFDQGARSPNAEICRLSNLGQMRTFDGLIRHMLGLRCKRFDRGKLEKRVAWAREELRKAEDLLAQCDEK